MCNLKVASLVEMFLIFIHHFFTFKLLKGIHLKLVLRFLYTIHTYYVKRRWLKYKVFRSNASLLIDRQATLLSCNHHKLNDMQCIQKKNTQVHRVVTNFFTIMILPYQFNNLVKLQYKMLT